MPDHFLRIDLDANNLERIVYAPAQDLRVQTRADAKYHVGLGPEFVSSGKGQAQRVPAVDHSVPHAIGDDGGLQQFRQGRHLDARVLGAAADHDQGALGRAEHLGRFFQRVVVGLGGRQRRRRIRQCDVGCFSPDV